MNAYILERIERPGWDEYEGHVVIADSPEAARKLANTRYAGEGAIWENPKLTTCDTVSMTAEKIVLSSFNAG